MIIWGTLLIILLAAASYYLGYKRGIQVCTVSLPLKLRQKSLIEGKCSLCQMNCEEKILQQRSD